MLATAARACRRLPSCTRRAPASLVWVQAAPATMMTTAAPPPRQPPAAALALALTIDYCASCGYGAWVAAAAAAAEAAAVAGAPVTVAGRPVARTGAFEVWAEVAVGGGGGGGGSGGGGGGGDSSSASGAKAHLAWSKLATGQPVTAEGVPAVVQAAIADARRRLGLRRG